MSEEKTHLTVDPENAGKRLDVFVASTGLSRTHVQKLVREGRVLINGKPVSSHRALKTGDRIELTLPEAEPWDVVSQDIPLTIVHEDRDVLVVDKPWGLVTHPAAGHRDGTLVNALLFHCKDLGKIGGILRPGLVHRLDKDTSGLLAVAKTERAFRSLTGQIRKREMAREYVALVHGGFTEDSGRIEGSLGRDPKDRKKFAVTSFRGKTAVTHYEVLRRYPQASWLRVRLETGRTHQIRVHLSHIGHPVWGDPIYGRGQADATRLMLHAAHLEFDHPGTGKRMTFDSPLPPAMKQALKGLEKGR